MSTFTQICFLPQAWEEYISWHSEDKKIIKRINQLIKSINSDGIDSGIGKPERLKHGLSRCYSRRIDKFNRLVYLEDDDRLVIIQCRNHY